MVRKDRRPRPPVDATLIPAPSSIKNATGERDPEMKQTKKGIKRYFGMKAHIGVDAHSWLAVPATHRTVTHDFQKTPSSTQTRLVSQR